MNPSILTISDDANEAMLARDIIEVHGTNAAIVVRENARAAALAGQSTLAKAWIRVLGVIQQRQSGSASPR